MNQVGKNKRLRSIFSHESGKIVVVPIDDSLLAGPSNGLEDLRNKTKKIISASPSAIIGFQGSFRNLSSEISNVPSILNLTASSTESMHTRKVLIGSLELAVKLGVEAVAVHVNISSKYEHEMLRILGEVSLECERFGMPLMGIMYPRTENKDKTDNNYLDLKEKEIKKYSELVAHSARIGIELGVDIIKTQYTGSIESFQYVVDCCNPIPVITAGGPPLLLSELLDNAYGALKAGAAGVSFGRNIYTREDPEPYIASVKEIIFNNKSVDEAKVFFTEYYLNINKKNNYNYA